MFACKDAYYDPYIEVAEDVPFCRDDSLICSPILTIAQSPKEFCEKMGFKVASGSIPKDRRKIESKKLKSGDEDDEEDFEEEDDDIINIIM